MQLLRLLQWQLPLEGPLRAPRRAPGPAQQLPDLLQGLRPEGLRLRGAGPRLLRPRLLRGGGPHGRREPGEVPGAVLRGAGVRVHLAAHEGHLLALQREGRKLLRAAAGPRRPRDLPARGHGTGPARPREDADGRHLPRGGAGRRLRLLPGRAWERPAGGGPGGRARADHHGGLQGPHAEGLRLLGACLPGAGHEPLRPGGLCPGRDHL
mmetsp:Transcript_23898/g.68369  ORF Transcript_23898/g.68369 Transcript_23898/m.68369 type:complete len:209 (-) Transcript_23898:595-1221(-)